MSILSKPTPTTTPESTIEMRKLRQRYNNLINDINAAGREFGVSNQAQILVNQARFEINAIVDVPEHSAAPTFWRILEDTAGIIAELRAFAATMPGNNPEIVYDSWYAQLTRWLTPNRHGHIRPMIELVGPAGCGKSFMGRIALIENDYNVYEVDCTEFQTPFDLIGRPKLTSDENGNPTEMFQPETVLSALLDPKGALIMNEFDALGTKASLMFQGLFQKPNPDGTGRYLTLPQSVDGQRSVSPAGRLPFIATSNTFGSGATRHYVRNRADGASLDRRSVIDTTYENEDQKLVWHGYGQKLATELRNWAMQMRLVIDLSKLPVILSTRVLLNVAEDIEDKGVLMDRALEDNFWGKLEPQTRADLRKAAL